MRHKKKDGKRIKCVVLKRSQIQKGVHTKLYHLHEIQTHTEKFMPFVLRSVIYYRDLVTMGQKQGSC